MKKFLLGIVLILVVTSAGPAFAESAGAEVSAIEVSDSYVMKLA